MYSNNDILRAIGGGQLGIHPFDPDALQPSSIDIRLDSRFIPYYLADDEPVDPAVGVQRDQIPRVLHIPKGEAFTLEPGVFVLGSTYERVALPPSIAARLEGKSSLGRLGLLTHATAGFIDPGFEGTITLELANIGPRPITLWPGMKIGQLCFFGLDTPSTTPYGTTGSHYQGQSGPVPSQSSGFSIIDVY